MTPEALTARMAEIGVGDAGLAALVNHLAGDDVEPLTRQAVFRWRTGARRIPAPVAAFVLLFCQWPERRRRPVLAAAGANLVRHD